MGTVTVLPHTTKEPISMIGWMAGVCWGGDVTNDGKNYRRGMDCILSGHGRAVEYPDVYLVIDGYSAKVIREWYTHIGCLPTRLQASTRYINYNDFQYVTPQTIRDNPDAAAVYDDAMREIAKSMKALEELGVPREDSSMVLPLCMTTKVVEKRNARNLIDMSRNRMCKRAYWEFRDLFRDICKALSEYSDQWGVLIESQMKPKCEVLGYCPEKDGCGRKPQQRSM